MTSAMNSAINLNQYIGLPYEAGAQGPDAYDCRSFFNLIQARHFGIIVPPFIAPDYDNPHVLADCFANDKEMQHWHSVDAPIHGDAVIIKRPMHVGTYLDIDGGGVLHCVKGMGVVFTPLRAWSSSGFGRRVMYRHQSKLNARVAA